MADVAMATSQDRTSQQDGGRKLFHRTVYSSLHVNDLRRLQLYQGEDEELIEGWEWLTEDVTDLHYAAFHGDLHSVKRLLRVNNTVDARTTGGPKLLKRAVTPGKETFGHEYVGFFVGTTPLMMASAEGHVDVIRFLVEHFHAEVNLTDFLGLSALALACTYGRLDAAKFLLRRCAYLNAYEIRSGMTALIFACVKNQTSVVKWLIKNGIGRGNRDHLGRHGVHYAAWNYNSELVDYFQQHHGYMCINLQDNNGNTPMHLLVSDWSNENEKCDDIGIKENNILKDILYCLPKTGEVTIDIHRRLERGTGTPAEELKCLVRMIKMGASFTIRNSKGRTVLHTLCRRLTPVYQSHGYLVIDSPSLTQTLLVMLKILLKTGCIPDEADHDGITPRDLCEQQDNWMAVKLLSPDGARRSQLMVEKCNSLEDTVNTYNWNSLIKAEHMRKNIEYMASAALNERPTPGRIQRCLCGIIDNITGFSFL